MLVLLDLNKAFAAVWTEKVGLLDQRAIFSLSQINHGVIQV